MATRGEPFDFWRTAHRAVRGRGRLVLLLAAAGGLLGAWAGLMLGQRVYAATGMVRIASVLPQVLHETDQNRPIAMFDGFIEAQKEVMISRETVQAAMKEDSWQQVARGSRALTQEQFAAGLKVETRPRSDHLRVTFRNRDPVVTAAAVRSIIAAYQQAFIREQSRVEGQRVSQLQTRRVTLSDSLKAIQDRIAQIAQGRSADSHRARIRSALRSITKAYSLSRHRRQLAACSEVHSSVMYARS